MNTLNYMRQMATWPATSWSFFFIKHPSNMTMNKASRIFDIRVITDRNIKLIGLEEVGPNHFPQRTMSCCKFNEVLGRHSSKKLYPEKVRKKNIQIIKNLVHNWLTDASSTKIEGSFFSVAITTPLAAAVTGKSISQLVMGQDELQIWPNLRTNQNHYATLKYRSSINKLSIAIYSWLALW